MICLLVTGSLHATNYYVSSSAAPGGTGTLASPWNSITQVNSFNGFLAGDFILFKSGETFYGSITVPVNGLSYSSYGGAARPTITGFKSISTGWTNPLLDNNWVVNIPQGQSTLNVVTLNGTPLEMGRYPNANAANSGYLSYEGSTTTSPFSITDNQAAFTSDWNGAEVIIRKKEWAIERHYSASITTPQTIQYTRLATNLNSYVPDYEPPTNGYGYFLQNQIKTLDQYGEWCYDAINRNLTMNFTGQTSPAGGTYNLKASTIDVLMNIGTKNTITISNIIFEGANISAIYAQGTAGNKPHHITVYKCDFNNIGARAVHMIAAEDVLVDICNFNWCLSNAVQVFSTSLSLYPKNCTIRSSVFSNIAPYVGMASFMDNGDNNAIHCNVSDSIFINKNRFTNISKSAIAWQGNKVTISYNKIENAVVNFTDQGAIYTYADNASTGYTNRTINNNIINLCPGQPNGAVVTETRANGIYLDGKTMNVDVLRNDISRMAKNGIVSNNPMNVLLKNNVLFKNRKGITFTRTNRNFPSVTDINITINANVFYSDNQLHKNISYSNDNLNLTAASLHDDLVAAGTISANQYGMVNPAPFEVQIQNNNSGTYTDVPYSEMTLEGWRTLSGQDATSTKINPVQLYSAPVLVGSNLYSNSEFNTVPLNPAVQTVNVARITATADATSKISGVNSLRLNLIPPLIPGGYSNINTVINIPQLDNAKNYVLRYSTLGTTTNGISRSCLAGTIGGISNSELVPNQRRGYNATAAVQEFLFQAPLASTTTPKILIETEPNSGTTYIDKVELYEATTTPYLETDRVRYVVNDTYGTNDININAPGVYYDGFNSANTVFTNLEKVHLASFSAVILFNVRPYGTLRPAASTVTAPAVIEEKSISAYPNPTSSVLTIDHLKASDKWEWVVITSMGGSKALLAEKVNGRTSLSLNVKSLVAGEYIATLRNKEGKSTVIKFIKL